MKLSKKKMVLMSFMLFSLFFGAGNLIFPPFLGQNAGSHTLPAMLGFLATAVVLLVVNLLEKSERASRMGTKREAGTAGEAGSRREPAENRRRCPAS